MIRGQLVKIILSLIFCVYMSSTNAQSVDSCTITPTSTASIEGIIAKGMLGVGDLEKIKNLISTEPGNRIIGFTYTIDCDNCDIITRKVHGDTFTDEDLKLIGAIKSKQILSFECIVGTNKKGELIAFKPFLFYIR